MSGDYWVEKYLSSAGSIEAQGRKIHASGLSLIPPMKGCRGDIPGSAPPLPASTRGSLLACWLDFSQTGLSLLRAGTRWATLMDFIDCSIPSTSGLSCREHAVVERSRFAAGGACCAGGCDSRLAIHHGFILLRLSGPSQSNFNRRMPS